MKQKLKDRLSDWGMILLFLAILAGAAYYVVKIMMKWKVKELG
jgi:hypothetical protein